MHAADVVDVVDEFSGLFIDADNLQNVSMLSIRRFMLVINKE